MMHPPPGPPNNNTIMRPPPSGPPTGPPTGPLTGPPSLGGPPPLGPPAQQNQLGGPRPPMGPPSQGAFPPQGQPMGQPQGPPSLGPSNLGPPRPTTNLGPPVSEMSQMHLQQGPPVIGAPPIKPQIQQTQSPMMGGGPQQQPPRPSMNGINGHTNGVPSNEVSNTPSLGPPGNSSMMPGTPRPGVPPPGPSLGPPRPNNGFAPPTSHPGPSPSPGLMQPQQFARPPGPPAPLGGTPRPMHPSSTSGGMPPMMQPPMGSQAPMNNQPPMGNQPPPRPGMPPMMQPGGGMPPRPGMMPPQQPVTSQPGGMPPPMMSGPPRPGMPPTSNGSMMPGPPRPGMPPTSNGSMMPQQPGMSQYPPRPGGMPPQPGGIMPPGPGNYPGMQQPPQHYPSQPMGGPAGGGRRTLDPDQMPSPITVMDDDMKNRSGYFDTREKGAIPPLVTTKFIARDYGNASPRHIRSTLYHIPATPDLMKQAGVPFGLVISPLAKVAEGEQEPLITDFGPSGPVRCARCKAYMCPFMQFVDGGRRFQCVFCKATTEVPQEYFQHLDHNGMRLDHYQRPELCMGTYEALATKDYCRDSKDPEVPGIIFAIDVSYPMIKEGVVNLLCQNMKELLKSLPRDNPSDKSKMKVGFMTYDNKINFYNINGILSQPQQMTVGDVNDMFVPLSEGFMTNYEEAEAVIDSLLEQIPQMFGDTRETETMLGPVIQAGKEAFKAAGCSGKLIVFHHNLPLCEAPGKLRNRDDRKVLNTEKEKVVLTPQTKFYNELGQDCVAVGCSVDLFLFNNAYIDVATLSQVCRLTGGQVFKYTYFQPEIDGDRFLKDLEHNLSRPIVFDAIMRVRTSTGVRPVDFFGSFFMSNSTDTELASLNSDMAIACEIKHDDKLTEEDGVYIQVALLFTSCSGQRRLRIMNLSLNTGPNLADMYRACELDTIINFTAKQSINRLMESTPKTVKESLINNCAHILACYRKNCASPSSAGQLILPECMKLLPLYTNCLIKSDALCGGADVGCDERAFLMNVVSSMDVTTSVSFFYPSLIPIHDVNPDENGIPDIIRCTVEKIQDEGVYLLENGLYLFMYIGLAADPSWIHNVFGVQTAAQIDIEKVKLDTQVRDNPISHRVLGIIEAVRRRRPRHMRLVLIRQREKLDILFRHYLCEDRSGNDGNFSYVDFLCHMHKEIRALLG